MAYVFEAFPPICQAGECQLVTVNWCCRTSAFCRSLVLTRQFVKMARNQEKAQSMMNRYLKGKADEQAGPKKLRPFLASECSDLHEADKWHHQIIREIGKKVSEIQNAGLGEHR